MKLYNSIFGKEVKAEITTNHAIPSYDKPVLLIDGEIMGSLEVTLEGYAIMEATKKERAMLQRGGYHLSHV